jgi:hypothetical protein
MERPGASTTGPLSAADHTGIRTARDVRPVRPGAGTPRSDPRIRATRRRFAGIIPLPRSNAAEPSDTIAAR